MTVCKRIGAWLLTLVLLVSALPYTAFAASEDSHVVNATMEETSVEDIASNVTTQLLRGAKTKNETLSMEAKPTHEDSDSVEIIVVVDDSVAKPAAQAQVQSLLQKQEKAAATMSRAIGETVEPQRQYTTLLNGFSATVTYGQYKALKELDCVESVFLSPTFSLLPDTANSTRMIGGGLANETGFTRRGDADRHSGYRRGHGPPDLQQGPRQPCPDAGQREGPAVPVRLPGRGHCEGSQRLFRL